MRQHVRHAFSAILSFSPTSEMEQDDFSSQEDEQDWDDLDDGTAEEYTSLFSNHSLPSLEQVVQYDTKTFGFNFPDFREQAAFDEIETILCINFIRSQVAVGTEVLPLLTRAVSEESRPWRDDRFMQPVLENDAFLLHDWETDCMDAPEGENAAISAGFVGTAAARSEAEMLRQENAVLRSTVQALAEFLPDDIAAEVAQRFEVSGGDLAAEVDRLAVESPSSSGRKAALNRGAKIAGRGGALTVMNRRSCLRPATAAVDKTYFDGYSCFRIHREMLSDKVRTMAYMRALEENPDLLNGARVLDVGCGTGILSMFAARAGAGAVIGVDGSKTMAELAAQNSKANGFEEKQSGTIGIVDGRLEDIQQLPLEQVDVIVSEWMGYTLLFETMLDTVLYARDRWLRPGGAILPDIATLYLAGARRSAVTSTFWDHVYGFSMEPVADSIWENSRSKAIVAEVAAADIVTEVAVVRRFDLVTMTASDADFSVAFALDLKADDQASNTVCAALIVWFDVEFSSRFCKQRPVTLSTSPASQQTHWAQTILPLKEPVALVPGGPLKGRVSIAHSREHRSLDISLDYQKPGNGKQPIEMFASSYRLSLS